MKFIELKNVNKVYSTGVTALADMSVTIEKGEFVFVIGHTASGKSTFIKMLYREEKPTSGKIIVKGEWTPHKNDTMGLIKYFNISDLEKVKEE